MAREHPIPAAIHRTQRRRAFGCLWKFSFLATIRRVSAPAHDRANGCSEIGSGTYYANDRAGLRVHHLASLLTLEFFFREAEGLAARADNGQSQQNGKAALGTFRPGSHGIKP